MNPPFIELPLPWKRPFCFVKVLEIWDNLSITVNEPSISATAFESVSCIVLKENGWYFKEKKNSSKNNFRRTVLQAIYMSYSTHWQSAHIKRSEKCFVWPVEFFSKALYSIPSTSIIQYDVKRLMLSSTEWDFVCNIWPQHKSLFHYYF